MRLRRLTPFEAYRQGLVKKIEVLWLEDGQFKAMVEMATDPVCGMAVEREKAISAEWNGQTLFFCSRGCRDEFMGERHGSAQALHYLVDT